MFTTKKGLSRVQVWTPWTRCQYSSHVFHWPGLEMLNWCFPQQQSCLKIEPQLLPLFFLPLLKNLFTKRLICALKHEFGCRLALLLTGPVKLSRSQPEQPRGNSGTDEAGSRLQPLYQRQGLKSPAVHIWSRFCRQSFAKRIFLILE